MDKVGSFFLPPNLLKSPNIDVFLYCIIMPSRYHPQGKAAIALLTEVSLYGYRLMEINTSLMRQPVYYGKLVRYKRQKDCIFVQGCSCPPLKVFKLKWT